MSGGAFRSSLESFALGGEAGARAAAPAKAATLDRLRREGLPVPPGLVFGLDQAAIELARAEGLVGELLALGPVIARSALAIEDQARSSGAGLGRSSGGLRTIEAVSAAVSEIAAEAARLEGRGAGGEGPDAVIVQAQIEGRALAVVACESTWPPLLEVFFLERASEGEEASSGPLIERLSFGASPGFSGALEDWRDPAAAAIARLLPRVVAVIGAEALGVEAELVIDGADRVWVVQARPLTRSLLPGYSSEFLPALVEEGAAIPGGRWALDAEHNPAPLSRAHAWLIEWLGLQRPSQRRYRVLAGWLYRRVDRGEERGRTAQAGPGSAGSALVWLRDRELPAARRRLEAIEGMISGAVIEEGAFGACEAALLAVIDAYSLLSRWTRRAALEKEAALVGRTPRCLVDRRRFADVLPTAWDVASPTLAEVEPRLSVWTGEEEDLRGDVDEEEAGVLLAELDDHLFALGLAPWRRLYLRAAGLLGVDARSVFLWTPPELRRLLRRGAATEQDRAVLIERGARARLHAGLRPPVFLHEGRPLVSAQRRRFVGLGIGARAAGAVAQRRDLEELLADPPAAGAVVVMPTLTAQAALAVAHLRLGAVVTAFGGALSHGALIARELGISALLGCRGCLELPPGTPVVVDTSTGWLRRSGGPDAELVAVRVGEVEAAAAWEGEGFF